MSPEYYVAYLTIVLVATISPGPSMLLALKHGASHGIRRTVYSSTGNTIGNLILAIVSIAGLGVLLKASLTLYTIVKWIGALYLIYLGVRTLLGVGGHLESNSDGEANGSKSSLRLFIDGFIIAIANPKGVLFFTAIFSQFVTPTSASGFHFSIILSTLAVIAFGCFMLYASLGFKLFQLFRSVRFRRAYNGVCGGLFILTGLAIGLRD